MDLKLILKYINYKLTAFTEHDVHSPFVYNFYMELIKNKNTYNDFITLNEQRNQLLKNESELKITDFGAGSKKIKSNIRKVKEITKHGIAQKKQAEFLYRLINKFQPKNIIELGTSVGLTTMYLSLPIKKSTIYTLEGCPEIYNFAQSIFIKNEIKNVNQILGNFDTELPQLLNKLETIDLIYIDGNHSYEATIKYFNLALTKKNANSIFIFDDINWSKDMQKAWKEIHQNSIVKLSMDFFNFGIVFFRTEQLQKEHFILKF